MDSRDPYDRREAAAQRRRRARSARAIRPFSGWIFIPDRPSPSVEFAADAAAAVAYFRPEDAVLEWVRDVSSQLPDAEDRRRVLLSSRRTVHYARAHELLVLDAKNLKVLDSANVSATDLARSDLARRRVIRLAAGIPGVGAVRLPFGPADGRGLLAILPGGVAGSVEVVHTSGVEGLVLAALAEPNRRPVRAGAVIDIDMLRVQRAAREEARREIRQRKHRPIS